MGRANGSKSGVCRVSLNERRVRRGTVARPTLRRSNFDPCRTRFPFCLCTQVWHRSRIGFVPFARDGASMTRDTRSKTSRCTTFRCNAAFVAPMFPTELSQLSFRSLLFTRVALPIFFRFRDLNRRSPFLNC